MPTTKIYAASIAQPGRPNEDAYWIGRLPDHPVAAVFDGEGHAEGAAKKAARQLERLYQDSHGALDWARTARILDSHLVGASKSTMVAASVPGSVISICAVGDSRAYLFRNGQTRILTENAGKRKLGSSGVEPLLLELPSEDRDLVLLMTDGAWTPLSLYALGQAVMKGLMSVPELPSAILKHAGRTGISDDMTVVLLQIRKG